ncbi:MAG: response regulator transcription factor [Verrucomicrobia bacterium]|nr:response regulator transcription factor [Verrucomicrobiota bacterium]
MDTPKSIARDTGRGTGERESVRRLGSLKRSAKKIRILIVDDHELVREGIRAHLEDHPACEVVGEAADGREAVAKGKQLQPDVVIMDKMLPEMDGLRATRLIRETIPCAEVLLFTGYDSEETIRDAIRAGVRGYVSKSDMGNFLVSAVEALSQHKPFFTSKASEVLLKDFESGGGPAHKVQLSEREREVLTLVAKGCSSKEIAERFQMSIRTVETHREHIMRKLNIHCIARLTQFAIAEGLVRMDEVQRGNAN